MQPEYDLVTDVFSKSRVPLLAQARGAIVPSRRTRPHRAHFDPIEGFYNAHQCHSRLDYLSPVTYEKR